MKNLRSDHNATDIDLYLTGKHECSYLKREDARTMFVDSRAILDWHTYQHFLSIGFRRSGDDVYRPHCTGCMACVAVRIPVRDFHPNRTQRRCWQRNSDNLQIIPCKPSMNPEHYALYRRYTAARHADGEMANMSPQAYVNFLINRWCPSMFVEFRQQGHLIAVAITDVLPNALSAMYTFFDPDLAHNSLGVLAVLWQVQEAKRRNLEHLYLGYWIGACPKMNYKNQYRPLEGWNGQQWQRYERGDNLEYGLLKQEQVAVCTF